MTRRTFLKHCVASGLGFATAIGSRQLWGDPSTDNSPPYGGPFYVVFNASGGWDTTYLMDPKGIGGINRLYDQGDIQTHGAHRFAPTAKQIADGMSNEDFFARYGAELLVMHGIDLSVNNHTPCARYMATGKLDSVAYPTFAALVAACRGADAPLAFLTFGNYSATGNLVPMSRVPYLQSLNLLAKADYVQGNQRAPYHEPFIADRIERALEEQFQTRVQATLLPRVERSESMLFAAQSNSKTLGRIVPYIPKEGAKKRLHQQCEIALAAFKAGVCVSANLSIGQFDSHNNNDPDQMKLIPEFLAGIDYLLQKSEELQIREKLVVIIQSEMGRTPTYNSGNGKDHWSINSIMFLGPGITGNRVLGATDDKQLLVPINPQTMAVDQESGIRARPEHIHQALRELAAVADHPYSEQFPLGVKVSERLQRLWTDQPELG
jgi:hypothetical protein